MKRLIYSSKPAPDLGLDATIDLITDAAERNARVGITGFILFAPRYFLQALEGEDAQVDDTFARIERDRRHSDLKIIDESEVEERRFSHWSMGFASAGDERKTALAEAGVAADGERPELDAQTALKLLSDLAREG